MRGWICYSFGFILRGLCACVCERETIILFAKHINNIEIQ